MKLWLVSGLTLSVNWPTVLSIIAWTLTAVNSALRSGSWDSAGFFRFRSKCSQSRPRPMNDETFGMFLTWLTMSTCGCGYMTCTSLFCSAVGSWLASVMTRKMTLLSFGLLPHHFGLGDSVTETLSVKLSILNGPPVQVGTVVWNHL